MRVSCKVRNKIFSKVLPRILVLVFVVVLVLAGLKSPENGRKLNFVIKGGKKIGWEKEISMTS